MARFAFEVLKMFQSKKHPVPDTDQYGAEATSQHTSKNVPTKYMRSVQQAHAGVQPTSSSPTAPRTVALALLHEIAGTHGGKSDHTGRAAPLPVLAPQARAKAAHAAPYRRARVLSRAAWLRGAK